MDNNTHLHVSQVDSNGMSRRLTHIRSSDAPDIEIFHEFDRLIPHPDDTVVDGHVLAVLLHAASKGRPLVVHGAMSRLAMRNIDQLLAIWSLWRPDRYKRIEVIPESIVDVAMNGHGRAICAFSGGVDATTTALRHTSMLNVDLRYRLTTGMVVHGFDVLLSEEAVFADVIKRVTPFTDSAGLDLRLVRTNSKEVDIQDWEDSHGLELAACLHMLAFDFDYGLIGGSGRYDELDPPWGSHPMTDPLMSGDRLTIIHDGGDMSRTEKVALVSKHALAMRTLRVCYAGGNRSGNCGKCPKCVKTQLRFAATGFTDIPPCFECALDIDTVRSIHIETDFQCEGIANIIAYAESNNVPCPWLPALKQIVARWERTGRRRNIFQRASGRILREMTNRRSANAGLPASPH